MKNKKRIYLLIVVLLAVIGCKETPKAKIETSDSNNQENKTKTITEKKSKLNSFSIKYNKQKSKDETDFFLSELATNYDAPDDSGYSCSIVPGSILKGDINGDGFQDVLFEYGYDNGAKGLISGWFIAFGNKANEYENYIYFDWMVGSGELNYYDLGTPLAIKEGLIYSEATIYNDYEFYSIKRKMSFRFDSEFLLLSLEDIESIKTQSNN